MQSPVVRLLLFFSDPATTQIYTLSLHDALPISRVHAVEGRWLVQADERIGVVPVTAGSVQSVTGTTPIRSRSEEHTSELQSRRDIVCRLLLEKKKNP